MKTTSLVLALFLTMFVTVGAVQKTDIELEVGAKLPAKYIPKNNRKLYMTHSAQLRPFIVQEIEGITYIIAYDEKDSVIKYISSNDKEFKSEDGLRTSDYIEVQADQVIAYPGWEIRGPVNKKGWQPLLGFVSKMTVLDNGKDTELILVEHRLPAGKSVKAKIIGFVKGSN